MKKEILRKSTPERALWQSFFFSRAMKPAGKTFTLSDCVLFSLCEEKMEKRSCVCSTSALSVEREFSSCFASLFHGENLPVCWPPGREIWDSCCCSLSLEFNRKHTYIFYNWRSADIPTTCEAGKREGEDNKRREGNITKHKYYTLRPIMDCVTRMVRQGEKWKKRRIIQHFLRVKIHLGSGIFSFYLTLVSYERDPFALSFWLLFSLMSA